MNFDTLSQDQMDIISPLPEKLENVIRRSILLLSQESHAQSVNNFGSVQEQLIQGSKVAQNKRERALLEYLEKDPLKIVLKKIHAETKLDPEKFEEVAKSVINKTIADLILLMWLLGKLFQHINPNDYDDDETYMFTLMDQIREMIPDVFNKYSNVKYSEYEYNIFKSRTEEALTKLASPTSPNTPIHSDDSDEVNYSKIAQEVNGMVRSTNIDLSHVRY